MKLVTWKCEMETIELKLAVICKYRFAALFPKFFLMILIYKLSINSNKHG